MDDPTRKLVAEFYEGYRQHFLEDRFGRWRDSDLDLHGTFVEAIILAAQSWMRQGHEGDPNGYLYSSAMTRLKNATGKRQERDKHTQSLDAPMIRRQRVRGVGDGVPIHEVQPLDATALVASEPPAADYPDVAALAGLLLTALEDGFITDRQAEAITRRFDLDGNGAAPSFTELGKALGIRRSASSKLYNRGIDGLRDYVEENKLTLEGLME